MCDCISFVCLWFCITFKKIKIVNCLRSELQEMMPALFECLCIILCVLFSYITYTTVNYSTPLLYIPLTKNGE